MGSLAVLPSSGILAIYCSSLNYLACTEVMGFQMYQSLRQMQGASVTEFAVVWLIRGNTYVQFAQVDAVFGQCDGGFITHLVPTHEKFS